MTTYGSYARQVMEQCEIPCFIDEKHSILMNPFVEYIRAAVNLVVEYFSYESMFRYLRCGLSGIPVYQVDQLGKLLYRSWNTWGKTVERSLGQTVSRDGRGQYRSD